jgi:hypothetical protein
MDRNVNILPTTLTGLLAILLDVQGAEGEKEAVPITMFLPTKKKKTPGQLKYCFEGEWIITRGFSLFAEGSWNITSAKREG